MKKVIKYLLPKRLSERISTIWRICLLTKNPIKNKELDFVIQMITESNSYLNNTGYLRSKITGRPEDQSGNAIPWINYATIDFLRERLNKNQTMFEYGSGYSTVFFANQVKSIVSVEFNMEWFQAVKEKTSGVENVKLIFKTLNEDYVSCISNEKTLFDIILIDGRKRVECAKFILSYLTENGVVILDDSERERYNGVFSFLKDRGYHHLTFTGLKAVGFKTSSTSIFYKPGNCLGI